MKNIKLSKLWDSLHSSYWFVPTLMAIAAVVLAATMLTVDRTGNMGPLQKWGWIYTGGPDGARTLLSAVAGSMVTVATTAFSIAIVALQLASSQFGPRLMRNFLQDTGNQIVLGTFVATFIYSLLVLRTIRDEDYDEFIPQISVTVGIVLAITSIAVLIYFIHHASSSMQASRIISKVGKDLDSAVDRLFPHKVGRAISESQQQPVKEILTNFDEEAFPVLSKSTGYIQAIDVEKLMEIATSRNLLIRVQLRPGKYVVQGSELVMVLSKESNDTKSNLASLRKQINDVFILGEQRTEQQDLEFCINQLVEVAVRAISPGINDPFTAIRCIDQLSAGICRLAEREFPSPYRYDNQNQLRVIAESVTFSGVIDDAFNQIRQYSQPDVAVQIRLLEAITRIAAYTHNDKDRDILKCHAEMISRHCLEQVDEQRDRNSIEQSYQAALKALAIAK
ncbi:DUF2254 domain-containing protein [Komarekiella sp. 'clone 1']|uniref:DUF2254 domain-containing protein n=1 Tax=Komarekiella delphini-convector SJRDD-AB1 TaxID=2593771 RepID=A0AA40SYB7_9NOST|nr:DUF2254 domain-containing protein [Komarekiella delphini-convector]MBD6617481.1 DUF2254 domain-containing protein [Komarekiella delphini-convector SJRDD-AB1]